MEILIVGKNNKDKFSNKEWKKINKEKQIGDYYSPDRYFTILNEFIDVNLKKYARFLFFAISYIMRSNNFKHETSIANGKSIWVWIVDIFCWICCIAFVVCLFTGIATPIIQAVKKGDFVEAFKAPLAIGLTITAVFTFSVAVGYIYMMTKIVAKNKTLNLQDYVFKKISYILKMSFLFDIRNKFFKALKEDTVVVESTEALTDANRWITLQINNLMYRLFLNFDIVLRFSNVEEKTVTQLQKIIDHDFKNLDIVILKEEDSKDDSSDDELKDKKQTKKSKKIDIRIDKAIKNIFTK